MIRGCCFILAPLLLLGACTAVDPGGTIAQLRQRPLEIREVHLDGGLEKAMEGYRRFLAETPDSPLAPEAIRRLADLKVEQEYGLIAPGSSPPVPLVATVAAAAPAALAGSGAGESEAEFEGRAAQARAGAGTPAPTADDLERAGALEAVALYRKLLSDYPRYQRNDQVLYQMSRAYEELGRVEEAMEVMNQLVGDFPQSRYLDEVQFRRAEYFFVRHHFLDAEDAYQAIVAMGSGSSFYPLALYKLGWTFYKQELYAEALDRFIALFDYQVSVGYAFEQSADEPERQRMADTFRVVSLSFSNLGGAAAVVDYFARHGRRSYEDGVYGNLGEYYFDKRRYSDAVATYGAFVERNPFHVKAPNFHMRIIAIDLAGGFPSLVIEAKKAFATTYGLQAAYWQHFAPGDRPEVLGDLKTNLTDLAGHYHALYQNPKLGAEQAANFGEALHWYGQFLASFPRDVESPVINHHLADLLLENRAFAAAALEYEKTAYTYARHEKSSTAGYAAVYAYRRQLAAVAAGEEEAVKGEVVRSSLKFVETFPEHEKAAIVLGAAADDLYAMGDYGEALAAARKLIQVFPATDTDVLRAAWLVVGHSSYEGLLYSEAEAAYATVLNLLPAGDKTRSALVDNLAAAIYRQGEQAKAAGDHRAAADHFLRVALAAPTSTLRPTAAYDAAAALMALPAWQEAIAVLAGFRVDFPGHVLQPEVTKQLAFGYRQDGQLALAATEYERIEGESQDLEIRREALLLAAQLHQEAGADGRALEVFRRYVEYFPQPLEPNLETRSKIAAILKRQNGGEPYLAELGRIVAMEGAAGAARTDRTRYLAAAAALVLAQVQYDGCVEVGLVKPFEVNLRKKQALMKAANQAFGRLLDYEVGEVTAAATFYLAELQAHFSRALLDSERPEGLSPLELEQYELAIEEQAYPFEEKAIAIHQSNLELIPLGIYNPWIARSLGQLALAVPARYARAEADSGVIFSLESFTFAIDRPEPSPPAEAPQTKPPL